MRRVLLALILGCLAWPALAQVPPLPEGVSPPRARVLVGPAEVVDGDSLRVQGILLRLARVRAIEKWNPLGAESAAALKSLIAGRPVRCVWTALDDFERPLVECHLAKNAKQVLEEVLPRSGVGQNGRLERLDGEKSLSEALVAAGWATAWNRRDTALLALEAEARAARRGLWRALRAEALRAEALDALALAVAPR